MIQTIRAPFYSPSRLFFFLAAALLITACRPGEATTSGSESSPAYPLSGYPQPGSTQQPPKASPTPGANSTAPAESREGLLLQSPGLKIAIRYPANWSLSEDTPSSVRYGDTQGFFRTFAIAGAGGTLDELAQMEIGQSQNPFGSDPAIATRQVGGQEARSITPSFDQPGLDQEIPAWGELIVAYPQPVLLEGSLADFLVLQADLQHLDEIAGTLTFDEANLADERFPAISDTPAAGICAEPADSMVPVSISLDIPSPRCLKIGPGQMISIKNQTGEPLVARLARYEFPLEAGEERSLLVPLGKYLAPGVHRLEILSGSGNGPEIWVSDPTSAENIQPQTVEALAVLGAPVFSHNGSTLVVPTAQGISLYNPETLSLEAVMEMEEGARYVAFSPDGTRMAFGGGWHLQLWRNDQPADLGSWIMVKEFTGSTSSPNSTLVDLGFSPDGELLAAGFQVPGEPADGAILMWSAQDGEFAGSQLGMTFDFSPTQPRLVAVWRGADQSTIYSYSFAGAPTDIFRGDEAFFSPTGLLAAWRDGEWRLTDMLNGETILSLNGQSLAFSPDGTQLALLEGGKVGVHRTTDGAVIETMAGDWEQAVRLQFSPDGSTLAGNVIGCQGGNPCDEPILTNAIWRLADGQLIMTFPGTEENPWFNYSPDGKRLAAASQDGKIMIWKVGELSNPIPTN